MNAQKIRQQRLAVERARQSINWLVKHGEGSVLKDLLSELHLQPVTAGSGSKKLEQQQPASTSLSRTTQTAKPAPAPQACQFAL